MRPGSTDPQVPGSNAARTFVFIKSGKFLKVRFTPKLFFLLLVSVEHMLHMPEILRLV